MQERLASIEGQVPNALRSNCRRVQLCRSLSVCVIAKCRAEDPPLRDVGEHHQSACWRAPLDPSVLVPAGRGGAGMT
jgi:peptide/nickel transport system ATP-binding protein